MKEFHSWQRAAYNAIGIKLSETRSYPERSGPIEAVQGTIASPSKRIAGNTSGDQIPLGPQK